MPKSTKVGKNTVTEVFEVDLELMYEEIVIKNTKEAVQNTKQLAPKRRGEYAKHFTFFYDKDIQKGVVYNDKLYMLAHLLDINCHYKSYKAHPNK